MTALVARTDRDGVTQLLLNRPEQRNALSTGLLVELREQLRSVRDDPAVRVVVLGGAGESFCAGADLGEFPDGASAGQSLARLRLVSEVLEQLMDLEQPTLATVNGSAVGAGWGLALACDLCFASAGAGFALPEVAKGYRLPAVLVARLVQVVGPVRAAQITFGGDTYPTTDAVAGGWVSRVLDTAPALAEASWDFATRLASRPRHSLAAVTMPLRRARPGGAAPSPELAWTEEMQ